jgi:predicted RNase H-like nuclease (RuvC/YqgF family)
LANLNETEEPKSIPYEEQLANLQLIAELKNKLEQEVRVRDNQIEELRATIANLQREKQVLQNDLTGAKVRLSNNRWNN